MTKKNERLLRDLSLMAQDAKKDQRKTEEDVAHRAINTVLDQTKKERKK